MRAAENRVSGRMSLKSLMNRHRHPLASVPVVLAFLVCGSTSVAFAQPASERAGARAAAEVGADAFDKGEWARALEYFKKAESLFHAPPHVLYLARANEKLGQLVEAREAYLTLEREVLSAQAPQAFRDAQASAARERAALEPRIATLDVRLEVVGEGEVRLLLNGKEMPAALVGVPRPVNPGSYELRVVSEGHEDAVKRLELGEGARETVSMGRGAPLSAASPTPPASGAKVQPTSVGAGAEAKGFDFYLAGEITGAVVGATGLALGTYYAFDAKAKWDEADGLFDAAPARNRTRIDSLDSEASSAKTRSIIGFVVGGAGVAATATFLILDHLQSDEQGSGLRTGVDVGTLRLRPWIGVDSAGLYGSF